MPTSAFLWGLQFSFLGPVLSLLLVNLFGASTAEVGWVLGIYNAGGFVASLVVPAYADRKHDYLRPMLLAGLLTVALAAVLAFAANLSMVTVALVALGGPAGVGSSLLFAQLRHTGHAAAQIVNTRALISLAWVAGPPLATVIMSALGDRAILAAIALIAVANIATTVVMIRSGQGVVLDSDAPAAEPDPVAGGRGGVALVMAAFVLLQATNATAMTMMTVYVSQTVALDVVWAGLALGLAAGLEVPALLLIGRLSDRFSALGLVATSCVAGAGYYLALAFVTSPVELLALQLLNAWSFAGVAGVGLPLFQQLIPRPGLATGLYANTRRIGAILSGPIIALGSLSPALGQRGIFIACAVITMLGLAVIAILWFAGRRRTAVA